MDSLHSLIERNRILLAVALIAFVVAVILFSTKPLKCKIGPDGVSVCSGSLRAPSKPGTYVYSACIDKNGDGDFNDAGECANITLRVV